jgi:membrane fusion protein (multidrug efflux system)
LLGHHLAGKLGLAVFVFVVVASVVVWWMRPTPQLQDMDFAPVPVEVVRVRQGEVSRNHRTNGVLTAVKSVPLVTEVNGRVVEVLFEQGAVVKRGELLVRLDDRLLKAQLDEAEAKLLHAEAEYKSSKQLYDKKFLAEIAFKEKLAKREVAKSEVEIARVRVGQMEIRAPFDGIVGLCNVSEGATITQQQEITTVVDLDPLYVDFAIPDSLFKNFSPNLPVDVVVDDGLPIEARVAAVDARAVLGTHSVPVRAILENPGHRMRPGQYAQVTAYLGREDGALTIPMKAVVHEGEARFVYVVIDNVVVRQQVGPFR